MPNDYAMKIERLLEAPEIYIDGYQGAIVVNGIAKINCFSALSDPASNKIDYVCAVRLAMSVTTLVQIRDALSVLISDMSKDGVIAAVEAPKSNV